METPKGKPVLVVHGGPGGGTVPTYARYFNPKNIYRSRGPAWCGKKARHLVKLKTIPLLT